MAVTVMTIGVLYDEQAPLWAPRGVGDWATTPADRPTETGRGEARGDQSGRRLRFAGRIPNFRSALCIAGAGAVCSRSMHGMDRGGRREGERSTVRDIVQYHACCACARAEFRHVQTKTVTLWNTVRTP